MLYLARNVMENGLMIHSIYRRNYYGNTAEHAKGKALREDSIRQGIVGHSISDAGALI